MIQQRRYFFVCLMLNLFIIFFLVSTNFAAQESKKTTQEANRDKVIFGFEEDTGGWEIPDWAWEKIDHVAEDLDISKKYAREKKKSLEVKANFPGGKWTAAVIEVMEYLDWLDFGRISCDVYLPKKAPEGLKAKIILTVGESWEWIEMSRACRLEPGKWVTLTADLKPGSTDWRAILPTNEFRIDVRKMVVRIESDFKPVYKGSIYIDNIRLSEPIKPEEMDTLGKIVLPEKQVLFGFQRDLEGWEIPDWAQEKTTHVGKKVGLSHKQASEGKSSMEVITDFPGEDWNEVVLEIMQFFDWGAYGRISADLYLPKDAPVGLKARIILTVGENWEWTEMRRLARLKPGEWVTVTADLKPGSLDWRGIRPSGVFRKDVRKMVIRIESYSRKAIYKGPIYIDNVRLTEKLERPVNKEVKSK